MHVCEDAGHDPVHELIIISLVGDAQDGLPKLAPEAHPDCRIFPENGRGPIPYVGRTRTSGLSLCVILLLIFVHFYIILGNESIGRRGWCQVQTQIASL